MITVEFRDFMEMKDFAKELLGVKSVPVQAAPAAQPEPAPAPAVQPAPVSMQQPVAPAPAQAPQVQYQASPAPAPQVQYQAPPAQYQAPAAVPTTVQSYTSDDLARAAMTLMDSGRQGELLQLLATFGVASLPALQPGQYGAFATALRGMGAQI